MSQSVVAPSSQIEGYNDNSKLPEAVNNLIHVFV